MTVFSIGARTLAVLIASFLLSSCGIVSCKLCARDHHAHSTVQSTEESHGVLDNSSIWIDAESGVGAEPIVVTVTGYGAPDDRFTNKAQRTLMAMRASEVEAYRTMAEHVQGVHVSSNTKVADFITSYDHLRLVVDSYIRRASVVSQGFTNDGYYETTLSLTLDQQFFGRFAAAGVRQKAPSAGHKGRPKQAVGQTFPLATSATLSTKDVHYDVGVDSLKR